MEPLTGRPLSCPTLVPDWEGDLWGQDCWVPALGPCATLSRQLLFFRLKVSLSLLLPSMSLHSPVRLAPGLSQLRLQRFGQSGLLAVQTLPSSVGREAEVQFTAFRIR